MTGILPRHVDCRSLLVLEIFCSLPVRPQRPESPQIAMPSEFLHFPPAYTLVGLYRLLTDPSIRSPVLAKVKHASIRGAVVALLYAGLSWNALDWVIRSFLLGNKSTYSLFGLGKLLLRKAKDVVPEDSTAGMTRVGFGRFSMNIDLVLCEFYSDANGGRSLRSMCYTSR